MNYKKFVSVLGLCIIIAYIAASSIAVVEVIQDRLQHNRKCLKDNPEEFDINDVTELIFPRSTYMPQRDEIACFVMTKIGNKFARSVIRRTWGKSIKPIFIMNLTDNNLLKPVKDEAVLFNDMIVVNGSISTDNEHLFAMKYFTEYFKISEYFLYVHDDVFINTKNLFNFLNDEIPSNVVVGNFGNILHQSKIMDWMSNIWNFSFNSYISRPDLSAFIAPGSVTKEMFNKLQKVSPNKNNQCTLDLLLKRNFYASKKFFTSKSFVYHPCLVRNNVLVNRISPSDMLDLWHYTAANSKACNIF
ncbi:beta-1,3-galactosyltransferase brn-like [Chironomus tepperi]|uniref:beta-1,3-galactosyltransferase brn-like n=1 Tax=Chironomus tepperi TaxID=113505 RepID=UPI00391F9F04